MAESIEASPSTKEDTIAHLTKLQVAQEQALANLAEALARIQPDMARRGMDGNPKLGAQGELLLEQIRSLERRTQATQELIRTAVGKLL